VSDGPGRYASLPRANSADRVADVVIPGTVTTRPPSQRGLGTDPLAVLQRSVSAKSDQQNLRVDTQTERPLSSGQEPTSTASVHALDKRAVRYPTESYDREANMNRLVKGGEKAAKPICTGC
jgi:hypothetical protein